MAPEQNLRHQFKTFTGPTKHIQQCIERVSRRDTPEPGNPVKQINGILGSVPTTIKTNQMGKNMLRRVELFDGFEAAENRSDAVELGGFGESFEDKVVGFRSWVDVVGVEGVNERRKKEVRLVFRRRQ